MDALKKTQDDLQRGKSVLDDIFQRLQREQVNGDVYKRYRIIKFTK